MKLKKTLKKSLSITTVICMILTSVSCAFTDLSSDHWAYDAVGEMVERDVLSGYNDGTFKPDSKITRAEFATILVKTLEITEANSSIDFKDVEGIHWAEEYIDLANTFLTGYVLNGEYYFKPEEPALREDAAVAIVSAKGLTNKDVDMNILNKFSDKTSISENLRKYVAIAVDNGLMKGNANGTFNPQGNLTRAEVAALFNNIYEYEEEYEKIAIGEFIKEELPDFKLNERDMTIDLGKDFKKYEFTLSGHEKYYWYSAANSAAVRNNKIVLTSLNSFSWDTETGISIREKNREDKGIAKVEVPRYKVTVSSTGGTSESHKFIPLQKVQFAFELENGEKFNEIAKTFNIDKEDIEIQKIGNFVILKFVMPDEDVKIEINSGEFYEEEVVISNEVKITSSNEIQKFARNFKPGDKFTINLTNGKIDGHYWESGKIIEMTYLDNGRECLKQINANESIDSGITMYGVELQTSLIGATCERISNDEVKLIFENNGKKYYSIADVELNHADAQTFNNFFCFVLNNSDEVEIEIVEEEKLPDFMFDEDRLILDLGEEWEKYEVSCAASVPLAWYRPLLKSKKPNALIPIRDNNKIYLEDVNVYNVAGGSANYIYVRNKVNTDLGYAKFEIPKNSLKVKCENATINYGKRIMPTSNVSVYIKIDDGYSFAGLGELSNITENDISIKNINKNEFQLNFKMPFEDVTIEVKTQSNTVNKEFNGYGIVITDDYKENVGSTVKKFVELLTVDGTETFETEDFNKYYFKDLEDAFVDYKLIGSKLKEGNALIYSEFFEAKDTSTVSSYLSSSKESKLAVNLQSNTIKANFKVVDTQKLLLEYEDGYYVLSCTDRPHQ